MDKAQKGFSLIELLVYIGIVVFVLSAISLFMNNILSAKAKNETVFGVEQNGAEAIRALADKIKASESVLTPSKGTTAETLVLNMAEAAVNPTSFYVSSGRIMMQEGSQPAITLTSGDLTVENLSFSNNSNVGENEAVTFSFDLNHKNATVGKNYSYGQTFATTVSGFNVLASVTGVPSAPAGPPDPWTLGPTSPNGCPCTKVDFDSLPTGTILTNQFEDRLLTVTAHNNDSHNPDKAIIFDSANPTGGDYDLGSTNEAFGGPGVGWGGGNGQAGKNDQALGKLLILAEDVEDANQDGLVDEPDDEHDGGWIKFHFQDKMDLFYDLKYLDVDANGGRVEAYGFWGVVKSKSLTNLGNNGVTKISSFMAENVHDLKISFTNSIGVDDFFYCKSDCD